MSLLERIDAAEGQQEIEQGKRLIRAGDDRGITLSQRLSYRLHRLARHTPGLKLRTRAAIKLLAVPKDPIAGDKAAGEALLHGRIVHGGTRLALDELDFADTSLPPAIVEYLHSFAWLRDLAAAATREKASRLAEKIAARWLHSCSDGRDERAWRPELVGRRILFWAAYAPYILSSRDAAYRSALLNTLARSARHLESKADKTPAGLPRVTAWTGVIATAVLLQGGALRLSHAETGFARALIGALHEDGGLVSRSPVEQLALVELLAQLRTIYYAVRRDMPDVVQEALEGSVSALQAVVLGDEALSSWQGGNMQGRRRVNAAIEGSAVHAGALRQARGWGYQRLAAKGSIVIFDGAPPPRQRALAGGCASTLAFEFSDGVQRVVVNCGGAGPWAGAIPPELAHALRYTAAHSTLTLGDRNSTAILPDGSLGKGVSQVLVSRDETGGIGRVEASHNGYVRRFGLVHERELILAADGSELRGTDKLYPKGRRRRFSEPQPVAVRFHLGPGVEVTTTADGQGALLRLPQSGAWQFRCRGGALAIEESLWVDGLGRPRSISQLVITGESPAEGISISWLFRRPG